MAILYCLTKMLILTQTSIDSHPKTHTSHPIYTDIASGTVESVASSYINTSWSCDVDQTEYIITISNTDS